MYDVGLIAFPWYPSLETGRGHDTYAYHLFNHLSNADLNLKVFPIIQIKQLQQGVNKLDYITKEALFFTKVFHPRSRIYHGISPLGAKTAILAGKKPLISTIHDAIPFIYRRDIKQAYERLCIKLCCEKSDKIIVTSEFTKNFLAKEIDFDTSKLKVIRYGVDHSFFFNRKKIKRKNNGKMLFSIVRWGDVPEFLYAFKEITMAVPDVTLFLGTKNSFESNHEPRIPSLLKNMGLEQSVKLITDIPINELPNYYNAADVYVSPSEGGFSLTLLEAMACCTPVVAFDLLDVPEYVGNGGIRVKPNDFQALANEIIRLLSDEKRRNDLAKESAKTSLNFSWQKMAMETLEVYREIISTQ